MIGFWLVGAALSAGCTPTPNSVSGRSSSQQQIATLPHRAQQYQSQLESAGLPPSAVHIEVQNVSLEGVNETASVTQITLNERIFFDINSDQPYATAVPVIKGLATALASDPTASMTVLGHTDATGTDDYNDALSKGRAENVVSMLVAFGAAPGS
jgi:outer membrane protein OmpA-like peptidoglycan-associated protein